MSTTFFHILESVIRFDATVTDAQLTRLQRVISHLDRREDRATPFQFQRTAKIIALWAEGAKFVRDPQCEEGLVELEQLFARLEWTSPPTTNALTIFRGMQSGQIRCATRYFWISLNPSGELALSFRSPVLLARVNAYIRAHWTCIAVTSPSAARKK